MKGKTLAWIVVLTLGLGACINHNKEDFFHTVGFINSQERHEFNIDIKSYSPFPWRLQAFNYSEAGEEYLSCDISITIQNIGSDIKVKEFYYFREDSRYSSYSIPSNQSKLIYSGSFAELVGLRQNENTVRISIETADSSNVHCKMFVQLNGGKLDESVGIALLRTEPALF